MKYYLEFTGWDENIKKVSFTRVLREKAGMTFHAAKRLLDALLLGEDTILEFQDAETAKEIKKETTKLGAKSKVLKIKSSQRELLAH